MITLSFLVLIQLAAAVLAVVDGILRVRGRGGVLPVVEIIVAALLGVSLFVTLPVDTGGVPLTATLALILAVVLALVLAFRGSSRRANPVLAVIALVLSVLVALMGYGWLHIPGING